ncbi:MAG: hypothetical protein NC078_01765 [Ruminococcus sp.]|nr:hypothetical protein [Ruminococcus sp.]
MATVKSAGQGGEPVKSYYVSECPKFVRDERRNEVVIKNTKHRRIKK